MKTSLNDSESKVLEIFYKVINDRFKNATWKFTATKLSFEDSVINQTPFYQLRRVGEVRT